MPKTSATLCVFYVLNTLIEMVVGEIANNYFNKNLRVIVRSIRLGNKYIFKVG